MKNIHHNVEDSVCTREESGTMTEEFRNIGKPRSNTSELERGDLEVGGMAGGPELLRINNPPEIVSKLSYSNDKT